MRAWWRSGAADSASAPIGLRIPLPILILVVLGGCGDDPTAISGSGPAGLAFVRQPTDGPARTLLPAVEIALQDAAGNVVTNAGTVVALSITEGSGAAGALLRGTLTAETHDGVARFDEFYITKEGSSFTLTATAAGLPDQVSAAFVVTPSPTAPNSVHLESDPGDYIGQGGTYDYDEITAVLRVAEFGTLLTVQVQGTEWWYGAFQVPDTLTRLAAGTYTGLERYPFGNPAAGMLDWYGEGRGCNRLTGMFTIDSVTYLVGSLSAIHLRFEQHCEGFAPALRGVIHWSGIPAGTPTAR